MAKKSVRSRTTKRAKADPCAPLRKRVTAIEEQIRELQDFLPEAPPSQRPRIRATITRLREVSRQLARLLRECERNQP
jgi:formate dehydrogenase maturation protein FdhE